MCLRNPQTFSLWQRLKNKIFPERGYKIIMLTSEGQAKSFYAHGYPYRNLDQYHHSSTQFDNYINYHLGFHVFKSQDDAIQWFNARGKQYLHTLDSYGSLEGTPTLVQVKYKGKHTYGNEHDGNSQSIVAQSVMFLKNSSITLSHNEPIPISQYRYDPNTSQSDLS